MRKWWWALAVMLFATALAPLAAAQEFEEEFVFEKELHGFLKAFLPEERSLPSYFTVIRLEYFQRPATAEEPAREGLSVQSLPPAILKFQDCSAQIIISSAHPNSLDSSSTNTLVWRVYEDRRANLQLNDQRGVAHAIPEIRVFSRPMRHTTEEAGAKLLQVLRLVAATRESGCFELELFPISAFPFYRQSREGRLEAVEFLDLEVIVLRATLPQRPPSSPINPFGPPGRG